MKSAPDTRFPAAKNEAVEYGVGGFPFLNPNGIASFSPVLPRSGFCGATPGVRPVNPLLCKSCINAVLRAEFILRRLKNVPSLRRLRFLPDFGEMKMQQGLPEEIILAGL